MILPKPGFDNRLHNLNAINQIFFKFGSKTEASLNTSDELYAQKIHINAMLRKHVSTSPSSGLEILHLGVNNLSLSHFIMPVEIRSEQGKLAALILSHKKSNTSHNGKLHQMWEHLFFCLYLTYDP